LVRQESGESYSTCWSDRSQDTVIQHLLVRQESGES
jgi:hypothetical protein